MKLPPVRTEVKKRSPLLKFGNSLMRSKDAFGHLQAAMDAHLSKQQLQRISCPKMLFDLQTTLTNDIERFVGQRYEEGVLQGKWLAASTSPVPEEVPRLKEQIFQLQLQYRTLHQQYLSEKAASRKNDGISLEELEKILCEDDPEVERAAMDLR